MKLKDLRAAIDGLDPEMELIVWDNRSEGYIPAGANVEEKTLAQHPTRGLEISSPNDYPRYVEGRGPFAQYAAREGLTQVRLEQCLVIG